MENATTIIWKLLMIGEKSFRRLQAAELLREVHLGVEFKDGTRAINKPKKDRSAA